MSPSRRHPAPVARLAGLAIATLLLTGCSRVDPALYEPLREQARHIGVEDAGPVLAEGTWGTGGFSSSLPTLAYLVGGCDAYDRLVERLTAAGYEQQSARDEHGRPASWWRRPGRYATQDAFIAEAEPGAEVHVGDTGTLVDLDGCATHIYLNNGRRPGHPSPIRPLTTTDPHEPGPDLPLRPHRGDIR